MSWLTRIAGTQAEYLASLGATPDIVEFITSQDPQSAQLLTNEFRKNPALTLQDLQQITIPQKREPEFTATEAMIAENVGRHLERRLTPAMVQLIDDQRAMSSDEQQRATQPLKNYIGNVKHWIKLQLKKNRQTLGDMGGQSASDQRTPRFQITQNLTEMVDWIIAERPEMASYTLEQAQEASERWHLTQSEAGENTVYDQTDPNAIAYGPQWSVPEWQGWTIQEVRSENDLIAEGNRMNHCVGSYCDDVTSGNSRIYSLRDPSNQPHVTLETDPSGERIIQIQGHSNSEPKHEYKTMLKEWFEHVGEMVFDDQQFDYDNYGHKDEYAEHLYQVVFGPQEYGMQTDWSSFDINDMYDTALAEITGRDYHVPPWNYEVAEVIAKAAHEYDKWLIGNIKNQIEKGIGSKKKNFLRDDATRQKYFFEEFYKWSAKEALFNKMDEHWVNLTDNWYNEFMPPMPSEDDYETYEEYEQAEKEWMELEAEQQEEAFTSYMPGAFDRAISEEMASLEKTDPVGRPQSKEEPYKWSQPQTENWISRAMKSADRN